MRAVLKLMLWGKGENREKEKIMLPSSPSELEHYLHCGGNLCVYGEMCHTHDSGTFDITCTCHCVLSVIVCGLGFTSPCCSISPFTSLIFALAESVNSVYTCFLCELIPTYIFV